jgi:hypothetical protein
LDRYREEILAAGREIREPYLRGRPKARTLDTVTGLSRRQLEFLDVVFVQQPTTFERLSIELGIWRRAVELFVIRLGPLGLVTSRPTQLTYRGEEVVREWRRRRRRIARLDPPYAGWTGGYRAMLQPREEAAEP